MARTTRRLGAPEWLIVAGRLCFIFVLALSAYWEADIRWLHFFQAWMYIAAIGLSVRGSRWGSFVGVSAAGLWDYANLFVTTFFFNGLQQLSRWIETGHLARPDIFIAVPAWIFNLIVVVGCVWAYLRRPTKVPSDIGRFIISSALTTGFFAADMAVFQPRILPSSLACCIPACPNRNQQDQPRRASARCGHSYRSATIGSTLAALRAGM
jgi:hypothetical protein